MNPRLLLSLWRERWGKATGTSLKVPYVHGKLNRWTDWLPYASAWSATGVSSVALLSCTLLLCLMAGVELSFNSQIVFSFLFVSIAVFIRRYTGMLITLVLVAMAVIASTRYLYWRFDATLVPGFSTEFLVGFYFWVAECYLALLVFAGLVQSIWPLRRAPAALPTTQDEWPTVDVFILCDDQLYPAIQATAIAARKLDWPKKKIEIHLIDGARRDDLYSLAASIKAHYLPHSDQPSGHTVFINRALPSTSGDFIAVFESGQVPDHHFLQATVGWFLRDTKLGLLQTLHHFLAPAPSPRDVEIIKSASLAPSCALIRRTAVIETGGMTTSVVTQTSHMGLALQASGYGSAYIGFDQSEVLPKESHDQNVMLESSSGVLPEVFLVEDPFASHLLHWKQRVASFRRALQFYYPVPQLLFFVAPLVYLLGHIPVIQTSPHLFMAYAVPYFLHGYIACARTDEKNRFKLFADIREAVLAWYILIPTTLTLLRTGFKQCLAQLTGDKPDQAEKLHKVPKSGSTTLFSPATFVPYLLMLSLNLAGFISGLFDIVFSSTSQQEVTTLYLLWTAYNLMLLAAMLAVAQEAKQIRQHINSRLFLPAMLKLPSGRTLSCRTENFPAPALSLSLPLTVGIDVGAPVSVSLFHAHREVVFPAVVVSRQDLSLGVTIADTAKKDYQLFAIAVLSRGPDWPKWLPSRGADRPFPKWMTDALVAVPIAILDFVTNINKHLHWVRLDSWIQLWRKKK